MIISHGSNTLQHTSRALKSLVQALRMRTPCFCQAPMTQIVVARGVWTSASTGRMALSVEFTLAGDPRTTRSCGLNQCESKLLPPGCCLHGDVSFSVTICLQRSFSGCCSSLHLEFLSDALPAAILLRLLPPLRCELQSDALPAAILLRLLLITAIGVSSAPHRQKQIVIAYHKSATWPFSGM